MRACVRACVRSCVRAYPTVAGASQALRNVDVPVLRTWRVCDVVDVLQSRLES